MEGGLRKGPETPVDIILEIDGRGQVGFTSAVPDLFFCVSGHNCGLIRNFLPVACWLYSAMVCKSNTSIREISRL